MEQRERFFSRLLIHENVIKTSGTLRPISLLRRRIGFVTQIIWDSTTKPRNPAQIYYWKLNNRVKQRLLTSSGDNKSKQCVSTLHMLLTSSCCDSKSKQCVSALHMLRAVATTSFSFSLIFKKLPAVEKGQIISEPWKDYKLQVFLSDLWRFGS